jgi:aminoglycoside phosphotransferase (APT) family kinase protein
MPADFRDDPFVRLVRSVHPEGRVVSVRSLKGGVSAQVYAVEVERSPEQRTTLVARIHGARDLARDPNIAQHEFMLLQLLDAAGLPVPKPLYTGGAGEIFPTPCLVTGFIMGETVLAHPAPDGYGRSLAEVMARIHAVDTSSLGFLPRMTPSPARLLRESGKRTDLTAAETQAMEILRSTNWPEPCGPATSRLLHADFWPGNILLRDGRVVGVIDWEDARIGDPLADVANTRLELLWAFGSSVMKEFTKHYQIASGVCGLDVSSRLPLWEIRAVLEKGLAMAGWLLDANKESQMRRLSEAFLATAIEKARRQGNR